MGGTVTDAAPSRQGKSRRPYAAKAGCAIVQAIEDFHVARR